MDCCRYAQEFVDEYDLADGFEVGDLKIPRVAGHRACALAQFTCLEESARLSDKENDLLSLVNLIPLVCWMAKEAGMETILSAAFSRKHETDMKRSFSTLAEAMDKAKRMRLTPEQAKNCIQETPSEWTICVV